MVSAKTQITNPSGLHLKPAAYFCNVAVRYDSLITITAGDDTANAKSVLSVLGACVKCGDSIEIVCSGEDEQEALDALLAAVKDGLGE